MAAGTVAQALRRGYARCRAPLSAAAIEHVTFMGRAFSVVPAVLVKSQVLRNNLGQTFLPADEFTPEWADQWNGVPVLVGDHPSERGVPSSGRRPAHWDGAAVGWIFNARTDTADGTFRLVGDVYLDDGRLGEVDGGAAILASLNAGQAVELSTGFSTDLEEVIGEHGGKPYSLVMHPTNADHLVISTELTGACSTRDGCGLGANHLAGNCGCGGAALDFTEERDAANDRRGGSGGGAGRAPTNPTTRRAAPSRQPLTPDLPPGGGPPPPQIFPPNPSRALRIGTAVVIWATGVHGTIVNIEPSGRVWVADANGRLLGQYERSAVSAAGNFSDDQALFSPTRETTMHEPKGVRALLHRVAAMFAANDAPTASVDGADHPASDFAYAPAGSQPSEWKLPVFDAAHVRAALARLNQTQLPDGALPGVKRKIKAAAARFDVDAASLNADAADENAARNLARELAALEGVTPSDQDRASRLRDALQAEFGGPDREVTVTDTYAEDRCVIFWFSTPMGAQPKGAEYYRSEWTEGADGALSFGEPTRVRRMTTYVPVGNAATAEEGDATGDPDAAAATQVTEEVLDMDQKELEQKLAGLATQMTEVAGAVNKLTEKVTAIEAAPNGNVAVQGLKAAVATLTDKVAGLSKITEPAIEEQERERQSLVTELAGNHRCAYDTAELETKPVAELRKIKAMVTPTEFGGRGGPHGRSATNEQRFVAPVPHFKKAEGKGAEQ